MRLKDFDFILPKQLIAQQPLERRDSSRLMVLDRAKRTVEHVIFHDLPRYLNSGDVLVANDTRVVPARLFGKKQSGGWVELFLLHCLENRADDIQMWECLLKSRRKTGAPATISLPQGLQAEVLEPRPQGTWLVRLSCGAGVEKALQAAGTTPLPPYIKRERDASHAGLDRERYQTVYAKNNGAVAAPTAGFHFTPALIDRLGAAGIEFVYLTLHVGYGTFQPIRTDEVEHHKMHKESFDIAQPSAESINRAHRNGGRIIAVGTTSTRVLETMGLDDGTVQHGTGHTDLYVYPGYAFKAVDALITNFHLPMSSLLLLVSAFAGKEFILEAYREAVEKKYRFFSYGDAMLII